MSDADKVALRTFLSTRRGEKVLQPDIQRDMLTYLVAKNRPLRELPIHPPDDQVELDSLVAEWSDYAEAANLDKPDVRNVERWISRKDGGVMRSERGGKAVAVADALAAQNKCTRHQSTTTCPRNVLTMDVWCEGEMGVATDVSIPPSVGPARSLAPLTSFTLFVHTAAMCEVRTSQIHFKSGVRSSKISSRGSAPHPARAHALDPRRVTIDNILLPGRVGNYWTNIFDKFRDP